MSSIVAEADCDKTLHTTQSVGNGDFDTGVVFDVEGIGDMFCVTGQYLGSER